VGREYRGKGNWYGGSMGIILGIWEMGDRGNIWGKGNRYMGKAKGLQPINPHPPWQGYPICTRHERL